MIHPVAATRCQDFSKHPTGTWFIQELALHAIRKVSHFSPNAIGFSASKEPFVEKCGVRDIQNILRRRMDIGVKIGLIADMDVGAIIEMGKQIRVAMGELIGGTIDPNIALRFSNRMRRYSMRLPGFTAWLGRNLYTVSLAVELPPMVGALDNSFITSSIRQRHIAMSTPIEQRRRLAFFPSKKEKGLPLWSSARQLYWDEVWVKRSMDMIVSCASIWHRHRTMRPM